MKQKKPSKVYVLKTHEQSSRGTISYRGHFQCMEYIFFTAISEERADELMSELFDKISSSTKKHYEQASKFHQYKSALIEKANADLKEVRLRGLSSKKQNVLENYIEAENLQAKDFLSPEEYELYNIPIWAYETLWDWTECSDKDKATVIKYWRENYLECHPVDALGLSSKRVVDLYNLPVIRREKPVKQPRRW